MKPHDNMQKKEKQTLSKLTTKEKHNDFHLLQAKNSWWSISKGANSKTKKNNVIMKKPKEH